MGDEAALQELSSGRALHREITEGDSDYGVKVQDLWRFMAARKGLAPAAVAIEQRTWHLLRRGASPKEDFRASLAEISAKERSRNPGLADLADAIKAAIDGDTPLANKLKEKLSASGFDTLSAEEIEFLADRSMPILRPIAQGATHAMLTKDEHVYSVPVLFEIPREIYIPWSTRQKNRPTVADIDVRILKASNPLRFESGNPAEGEATGKVFVFVCQPQYMDKALFAEMEPMLRDAIERVFSRYGLHLGRNVSVEGVPMRGSGFDEIAKEMETAIVALSGCVGKRPRQDQSGWVRSGVSCAMSADEINGARRSAFLDGNGNAAYAIYEHYAYFSQEVELADGWLYVAMTLGNLDAVPFYDRLALSS